MDLRERDSASVLGNSYSFTFPTELTKIFPDIGRMLVPLAHSSQSNGHRIGWTNGLAGSAEAMYLYSAGKDGILALQGQRAKPEDAQREGARVFPQPPGDEGYRRPSSFLASSFLRPPIRGSGLPEPVTTKATRISSSLGAS